MSASQSDTQPNKPQPQATRPSTPLRRPNTAPTDPGKPPRSLEDRPGCIRGFLRSPVVIVGLFILLGLFLVTAASAAAGWSVGLGEFNATATIEAGLYMLDQYNLALDDMEAGNYSLARQRLEYIFSQDPDFLDVNDKLVQVLVIMQGTVVPTGVELLEASATPTQDPRPKEELFTAAQALINARDWTAAIDTLLALRKADPAYRTADVDGWLYAALRNRGVHNILDLGLFEPGLYDFALAETFGPIDNEASILREGARYYLYGNAFWLAYPQDAAYYYGLSMSIAPGLHDAGGLTAFGRFWQSLVHWGDQLAVAEDWCGAYEHYQDALAARQDSGLQPTANAALEQCVGPTETPSLTPSITLTPLASFTPSATGVPPSDTPGPSDTPTDTSVPPSDTPMPSDTPTETETPTP